MRTCNVKINGIPCGKPSFANSNSLCEDHYRDRYPTTYARILRQEAERKAQADKDAAELEKNRRAFDP